MYIREAEAKDLEIIVDIYNQSIPSRMATADTNPITVEERLNWYHRRPPNRPIWVATDKVQILGWLSFQNFYGRPAYQKTAEISVYVSNDAHRLGIGSLLLTKAIADSPQLEITHLLGFIFAHNQPSLKLFTKHGFQSWGHLPDVAELDDIARSLVILGRQV